MGGIVQKLATDFVASNPLLALGGWIILTIAFFNWFGFARILANFLAGRAGYTLIWQPKPIEQVTASVVAAQAKPEAPKQP